MNAFSIKSVMTVIRSFAVLSPVLKMIHEHSEMHKRHAAVNMAAE